MSGGTNSIVRPNGYHRVLKKVFSLLLLALLAESVLILGNLISGDFFRFYLQTTGIPIVLFFLYPALTPQFLKGQYENILKGVSTKCRTLVSSIVILIVIAIPFSYMTLKTVIGMENKREYVSSIEAYLDNPLDPSSLSEAFQASPWRSEVKTLVEYYAKTAGAFDLDLEFKRKFLGRFIFSEDANRESVIQNALNLPDEIDETKGEFSDPLTWFSHLMVDLGESYSFSGREINTLQEARDLLAQFNYKNESEDTNKDIPDFIKNGRDMLQLNMEFEELSSKLARSILDNDKELQAELNDQLEQVTLQMIEKCENLENLDTNIAIPTMNLFEYQIACDRVGQWYLFFAEGDDYQQAFNWFQSALLGRSNAIGYRQRNWFRPISQLLVYHLANKQHEVVFGHYRSLGLLPVNNEREKLVLSVRIPQLLDKFASSKELRGAINSLNLEKKYPLKLEATKIPLELDGFVNMTDEPDRKSIEEDLFQAVRNSLKLGWKRY